MGWGGVWFCFFFFSKQKTAYELRLSLVGSEMLIRDRPKRVPAKRQPSRRIPVRQTSQRPGEMTVSNPRGSVGLRPRGAGPHFTAKSGSVEHRRSRAPQPRQIA